MGGTIGDYWVWLGIGLVSLKATNCDSVKSAPRMRFVSTNIFRASMIAGACACMTSAKAASSSTS